MAHPESDFDPNDVAEEYELDDFEGDNGAADDEFNNEDQEEEALVDSAAFEGFEDEGEHNLIPDNPIFVHERRPSTFTFQVHNGKQCEF